MKEEAEVESKVLIYQSIYNQTSTMVVVCRRTKKQKRSRIHVDKMSFHWRGTFSHQDEVSLDGLMDDGWHLS